MITQRPVTGSLVLRHRMRSEKGRRGTAFVERSTRRRSGRAVGDVMSHHVIQARASPPAFGGCDRFDLSPNSRPSRLHFNEHQRRAVLRDDVQFSTVDVASIRTRRSSSRQARSSPVFRGYVRASWTSPQHPRPDDTFNCQNPQNPQKNLLCGSASSAFIVVPLPPQPVLRRNIFTAMSACSRVNWRSGEPPVLPPRQQQTARTRRSPRRRARQSRSFVCRSRTSSTPTINPRPRTSPTSGCFSINALRPFIR